MSVCIHAFLRVYMHACACVDARVCVYLCVCVCARARMCVCVHACMHVCATELMKHSAVTESDAIFTHAHGKPGEDEVDLAHHQTPVHLRYNTTATDQTCPRLGSGCIIPALFQTARAHTHARTHIHTHRPK